MLESTFLLNLDCFQQSHFVANLSDAKICFKVLFRGFQLCISCVPKSRFQNLQVFLDLTAEEVDILDGSPLCNFAQFADMYLMRDSASFAQ